MSTPKDHVPEAIDRVASARDEEADRDWAQQAAARMLFDDVDETRIVEALDDVAEQVEASQESPEDLFGDPVDWAQQRQSAWRDEGVELTTPTPLTLRRFCIETLITASVYSGMFLLMQVFTWSWSDPLTLSWLLAPLALALTSRAIEAAFTAVRAARTHALGVVAAVLTGIPGVALTVGVFAVGNGIGLPGTATLGVLGATVGYGVLAWALASLWPERAAAPTATAPQDDDAWLRSLGRALRSRGDITDARAEEIMEEASAHAHEAGTSLTDEFGSPRAYAERFTADRRVSGRRRAWFWTVLASFGVVFLGIVALDGTLSVWNIAWLLLVVLIAVLEWRRVRRVSSAPGAR